MWIAEMQTEHFVFEGTGRTATEAKEKLESAAYRHGKALGLDQDWWKGDKEYDVTVRQLTLGRSYRDRREF